jgi:hypothetical protein
MTCRRYARLNAGIDAGAIPALQDPMRVLMRVLMRALCPQGGPGAAYGSKRGHPTETQNGALEALW